MKIRSLFNIGMGLVVIVCFTATMTGCYVMDPDSWDNHRYRATDSFNHEIDVEAQTSFNLYSINGDIDIYGTNQENLVKVWGEKNVKADDKRDAEYYLEMLRVIVTVSDEQISVRTDQPKNASNVDFEVVYHVELPETWSVSVDHVNGDVLCEYIHSSVSIDLTNGDIGLNRIQGSVWSNLVNGDVQANVILPVDNICQIRITNGDIQLAVPDSTSAEFYAEIANGDIRISKIVLNNMQSTPKWISGILGDGEGKIDLRAINGDIEVQGY